MTGMPSVRVDDLLIHPRDRDLIVGTHGRSIYIADDISPLEQLRPASLTRDVVLFDPRPATLWKNDPQSQRHSTNRQFQARNPQGGTAIHVLAKSDLGAGKLEFLQGATVAGVMEVQIKAGMNRFQWSMRGMPPAGGGGRGAAVQPAPGADPGTAPTEAAAVAGALPPAVAGGGRGGRGGGGVPFVASAGRGGGGTGGFGGFDAATGALLEPGHTWSA